MTLRCRERAPSTTSKAGVPGTSAAGLVHSRCTPGSGRIAALAKPHTPMRGDQAACLGVATSCTSSACNTRMMVSSSGCPVALSARYRFSRERWRRLNARLQRSSEISERMASLGSHKGRRGPGLAGSAIRRRGLIGSRPYKILGGPRWPRRQTYQA